MTAFICLILNLVLPEEVEDEETQDFSASELNEVADEQEWRRIQRGKELDV